MFHTEIIPLWFWPILIGVPVGAIWLYIWNERRWAAELKRRGVIQRKNAARFKAWQWVFGRSKQTSLMDLRSKAEKDQPVNKPL
ncbi:MAG: hypothetical protein RLY97_1536 [Pseudomonadota bacterium]|jgi:hypothetical protein